MTDIAQDLLIEIDISSYWHAGTGRAGGDDVDALIDKDKYGLPLLRGRHLKGLIREAGERLVEWNADGWTENRINILFGRKSIPGNKSNDGKQKSPGQPSSPGCIRFSDAKLPPQIAEAVRKHEIEHDNRELATSLIRRLASTRIKFETGAAMNKTLRSVEVGIPLKLFAELRWDATDRQVQSVSGEDNNKLIAAEAMMWRKAIPECLPYVLAVGANRNRGFGRAKMSVVEV